MRDRQVRAWIHTLSVLAALSGCGGDGSYAGDGETPDDVPRASDAAREVGDAGSTSSSDAGAPNASQLGAGASSAICPLGDTENVCSTCLKFSCCDEISACGPACQALVTCVNACPPGDTNDGCGQACVARNPDGASAFTAFAQCVGVQCEDACTTHVGDASMPASGVH